jgi:hypothetical protein
VTQIQVCWEPYLVLEITVAPEPQPPVDRGDSF